jgi:hypothetical protein
MAGTSEESKNPYEPPQAKSTGDEPPKVFSAFGDGREEWERERLVRRRESGWTVGKIANVVCFLILFWIVAGLLWLFLEGILR